MLALDSSLQPDSPAQRTGAGIEEYLRSTKVEPQTARGEDLVCHHHPSAGGSKNHNLAGCRIHCLYNCFRGISLLEKIDAFKYSNREAVAQLLEKMEAIRLYTEPKLSNPLMIAAWPGMGGVAIVAAKYLTERLDAQEFGSIEPDEFFDLGGVLIENSVVEEIGIPEGKFYFYDSGEGNDLIIFMSEAQPQMKGYGLANLVLDVAQRFKVRRLYTFAAAPTHIYHTNRPKVLAVATNPRLVQELEKYDVTLLREGSISGLNGLLLGVAKQRNIDGICLLGEIPIYTTQVANPRSSKAVLEILTQMTGLEIDMTEIDSWAKETDREIEEKMAHLREFFRVEASELIDYFERLAAQKGGEEMQPDYSTDELVKEIERFLREKGDKGEDKGGH